MINKQSLPTSLVHFSIASYLRIHRFNQTLALYPQSQDAILVRRSFGSCHLCFGRKSSIKPIHDTQSCQYWVKIDHQKCSQGQDCCWADLTACQQENGDDESACHTREFMFAECENFGVDCVRFTLQFFSRSSGEMFRQWCWFSIGRWRLLQHQDWRGYWLRLNMQLMLSEDW